MWILSFLPELGTALAVAALAWFLHSADVDRIEANHQQALHEQEIALNAQCEADKAITTEVSHDYENSIADLALNLSGIKRLQSSTTCIVPLTGPATERNDRSCENKLAGAHGVPAGALYDYAGEAEKYRLQLIACQSFIKKTWARKP